MDRGERRRRDENYVRWMVKRYCGVMQASSFLNEFPFDDRFLGLRKYSVWACHHCSKKRPGRPKVPRGTCGLGMD